MQKILFVFLLILPFVLAAQGDAPTYTLYEDLLITPKRDKVNELRKNIAAHNKKYHNEGPYRVNVFQVIAGPNTGKMIWSMGPCNFGHLDSNPGGEAHNQDWVNNIIPLTEDVTHNGFWGRDDDLSYYPEGANFTKYRVRTVTVKRGDRYRFDKLMANIRDVYAKNEYKTSHVIFDRKLASNDGRDVDVVFGYNSWAELERPGIAADYDEVHGKGSWQLFLEELEECVEGMDDELWQWAGEASADVKE